METKQWPTIFQQSVATVERTDDMLNNGNTEDHVEKSQSTSFQGQNAGNNNNPESRIGNAVEETNHQRNVAISETSKQAIHLILEQIKSLSQIEQYYLYLKLPAEVTNVDPFRQTVNPLGSRQEIQRTITWIKSHLEEDPDTSLPKQEVYTEYFKYCTRSNMKSLSQADFGKVMKQVYPKVRARRLGVRGKSRYCYAGLKRCIKLQPPLLPDLTDQPMSTEAPYSHSNLTSLAWMIVKDWSQKQLGVKFNSLHNLACYLIFNNSVDVGTEAANKLTAITESQLKAESNNSHNSSKNGNKHREMQLQLQKKIQQKNEVNKERKRKMQSPKADQKTGGKKSKTQSPASTAPTPTAIKLETSPLTTASSVASELSTSSNSTSPSQGKPNCDKSLNFTQQPALPDFKSFQQKSTTDGILSGQDTIINSTVTNNNNNINKIAIPRLQTQTVANVQISPTKKHGKNAKYKAIQPRLQQCDIASYNLQPQTADNRSQDVQHNLDRIKERKYSDDEDSDFPLPRERLNSIGNVDKDAMDEYLGANNSQHEEEMSKYFPNKQIKDETKFTTLRLLLEQNLADSNAVSIKFPNVINSAPIPNANNIYQVPCTSILNNHHAVRRRVSFETPAPEETVPPSPNTKRKNFSFTPISPGPQSPNGIQSKCSSTNASPFVSPRNTPIPRTKNNLHQNAGILLSGKSITIKKENDVQLDLSGEQLCSAQFPTKNYMPVSAPASPMLQTLLNPNNKVTYKPGYSSVDPLPIQTDTSHEISQFLANNVPAHLDVACRSQSVPVHQMHSLKMNNSFLSDLPEQNGPASEFNEIDPIVESDSDNVKQILNALNEQPCDNNNIDVFGLNHNNLNEFGLHLINNNIEIPQVDYAANNVIFNNIQPCSRAAIRSHSIDVQYVPTKNNLQCRSVPCTPLPLRQHVKPQELKNFSNHQQHNSRSYPSTPLNLDNTKNFSYNLNGDCLLNGQPIRTDDGQLHENLNLIPAAAFVNLNGDNNDKGFNMDGNEFENFENSNALMDENCVLIEQNYDGNIN